TTTRCIPGCRTDNVVLSAGLGCAPGAGRRTEKRCPPYDCHRPMRGATPCAKPIPGGLAAPFGQAVSPGGRTVADAQERSLPAISGTGLEAETASAQPSWVRCSCLTSRTTCPALIIG